MLIAFFAAGFSTWALMFDVQGLLPIIGEELGLDPATAALALSFTTFGLAIGVLPWSGLADRIGRDRAMKIALCATALLSLVSPWLPTFETFVAVRFLLGLALAGLPAVSMAYLADAVAPAALAQTAGLFVSGNTIGGLAGRVLGGMAAEAAGWRIGILAVSVVGVVACTAFLVLLPRQRGGDEAGVAASAQHDGRRDTAGGQMAHHVLAQLRDPTMRAIFVCGVVALGAFTAVYNYLPFHLRNDVGLSPAATNLLFLGLLAGSLGSGLAGRFRSVLSRQQVILVGFGIGAAGLVLTIFPSMVSVFIGVAMLTFGVFLANAVAYGWAGEHPAVGRSQATALFQLFNQIGNGLVGWSFGYVYAASAWPGTAAVIGLFLLVGAVVAWLMLGDRRITVIRGQ